MQTKGRHNEKPWRLHELLGTSADVELRIVHFLMEYFKEEDETGGMVMLTKMLKNIENLPPDEVFGALLFFGRHIGNVETEERRKNHV